MAIDKTLMSGSISLLLMKLLEEKELYGYQMIEALRQQSDHTFDLKAGTLYPLLHTLEQKGYITAREAHAEGARPRRYYRLTKEGRSQLARKEEEWRTYARAVNLVLNGGACHA